MGDSNRDSLLSAPRIVERGLPLDEAWEEVEDEFEDFHPAWRKRQCIMSSWMCLTILLLCLCPFGLVGGILACLGAGLYVCRCCQPRVKAAGLTASKTIFVLAIFSSFMDAVILAFLVTVGVNYLLGGCGQDISEDACTVRKIWAIMLLCCAIVAFIHLLVSMSVFFSMRKCHRHIQASEYRRIHDEEEQKTSKSKKSKRKHKHKHRSSKKSSKSSSSVVEAQEGPSATMEASVAVVVED